MGKQVKLEPHEIKELATLGAVLLKPFHEAYAVNRNGLDREYRRGIVVG